MTNCPGCFGLWKWMALLVLAVPTAVAAGPALIVNKATGTVEVTVEAADGTESRHRLRPDAVLPLAPAARLSFGDKTKRFPLATDTLYRIVEDESGLDLVAAKPAAPASPRVTIAVKIMADEDQRASRERWEKRLRDRMANASAIFEANFGVKFEVTDVGRWTSDDALGDFKAALEDFEKRAERGDAGLVVGFTSQKLDRTGRVRLGVTRRPFHSHILVSEWSRPTTEKARLEVLVHELGHYLGAVHSPDRSSVMRPSLRDGQALRPEFHIVFDPVNALILDSVAEEMAGRPIRRLEDLSTETKRLLRTIYGDMARVFPDDQMLQSHVRVLEQDLRATHEPKTAWSKRAGAVRRVVAAVVEAAEENRRRPIGPGGDAAPPFRLTGDPLTDYYVRRAAKEAATLPEDRAGWAFLVGLAVALDRSDHLRENKVTGAFLKEIESDAQRKTRLRLLGFPTMRGRQDLLQHYVVASGLTAFVGPGLAEIAGLQKEIYDARDGGSGFSFHDLAADLAGIALAKRVLADGPGALKPPVDFSTRDYLPAMDDLEEDLGWADFAKRYGSVVDRRFRSRLETLRRRAESVPGLAGNVPHVPGP